MPYFTKTVSLPRGNVARGEAVENEFLAVESGFSLAEADVGKALRFSTALSAVAADASARANKTIAFDASGNPYVTAMSNVPSTGGTITGTLTVNDTVFRDYTSADTDITALVSGTAGGTLISGRKSSHVVIFLRSNESGDSFNIVTTDPALTDPDGPAATNLFQVKADNTIIISGSIQQETLIVLSSLGYSNGWVDYNSTDHRPSFYKDKMGRVHIHGMVKSGIVGTICTLPAGYRPAVNQIRNVADFGGTARVDIAQSGVVSLVSVYSGNAATYLSLSGLSFRAA